MAVFDKENTKRLKIWPNKPIAKVIQNEDVLKLTAEVIGMQHLGEQFFGISPLQAAENGLSFYTDMDIVVLKCKTFQNGFWVWDGKSLKGRVNEMFFRCIRGGDKKEVASLIVSPATSDEGKLLFDVLRKSDPRLMQIISGWLSEESQVQKGV